MSEATTDDQWEKDIYLESVWYHPEVSMVDTSGYQTPSWVSLLGEILFGWKRGFITVENVDITWYNMI